VEFGLYALDDDDNEEVVDDDDDLGTFLGFCGSYL